MDMAKIDPNFRVESDIREPGLVWLPASAPVFSLHGVLPPSAEENYYRRLPTSVAEEVSPGTVSLHAHCAGGRIRFVTDSPYIAIQAKMRDIGRMPHFAMTGSSGFDLYADDGMHGDVYECTFVPPFGMTDGYESLLFFRTRGKKTVTVNFPLYSEVVSLSVGLHGDALLERAEAYRYSVPVVYYGSSITQGGCASRPGNSYQGILTRMLGCDHINLGFSGNAKGEQAMARYIAGLDMSVFVMDYDHNAPNPEHLRATHAPFFRTVREAHPDLPVVMINRPKLVLNEEEIARRQVVVDTYEAARAAGDENVYFVDGSSFFADYAGDSATVDGSHPNDLGFMAMARGLEPLLRRLLEERAQPIRLS